MKIAIVKLSALGDIIQSAFVVQFIKAKLPDTTIHWIVEEKFADILKDMEGIDEIKTVNLASVKKRFRNIFKEIKKIKSFGEYDMVIDMQGLLKSAIVARCAGKNVAGFDKESAREKLAALFYKKRFFLPYAMHTGDRYRLLAANALDISITKAEVVEKKPYMTGNKIVDAFKSDKKRFVFIVGSTWESRCYPKKQFLEVAKGLEGDIFIPFGNDMEYNFAKYLEEHADNVTVLPRLDLCRLRSVIAKADLVIGNDTGPTYLGWANNVPTVILFGPTPAVRVYETPRCRLLKSPSKVDPLKLDKGDFSIQKIAPRTVIEAANELLQYQENKGL